MSDTRIDVAKIKLSSTVFPTAADRKLWDALSPEDRQAVIIVAEETGFQSGEAPVESIAERLARVRAEPGHGL
jgi:hypothetical protein